MHHRTSPRSDEKSLSVLLQTAGVPHELIDVASFARTAQEAADCLGAPLAAIVKSLVCTIDGVPVVALVPGNRTLSFDKLGRETGAAEVKLAGRKLVETASGYAVGAVSPVGLPPGLEVYGDAGILSQETVYCGAGSDHHMVRISPRHLGALTPIRWADLCD